MFYREFTRQRDFAGFTQLAVAHTHALALGTTILLVVLALTKVFAAEWAAQGVRVNAVAPGYVWTSMIEKAVASGVYGGADILDKVPARRYAKPEDIADAVLYLVSDGADFVHGQTLVVDGG